MRNTANDLQRLSVHDQQITTKWKACGARNFANSASYYRLNRSCSTSTEVIHGGTKFPGNERVKSSSYDAQRDSRFFRTFFPIETLYLRGIGWGRKFPGSAQTRNFNHIIINRDRRDAFCAVTIGKHPPSIPRALMRSIVSNIRASQILFTFQQLRCQDSNLSDMRYQSDEGFELYVLTITSDPIVRCFFLLRPGSMAR